jgi:polyribonucleotide nucleotidyltransferase
VNNPATDIMQIRDETQTKIDLPAEGEKSDVITITGKRENVQEARERIQKIQNELVSNVSKYLEAETYHIYLHNLCTFWTEFRKRN